MVRAVLLCPGVAVNAASEASFLRCLLLGAIHAPRPHFNVPTSRNRALDSAEPSPPRSGYQRRVLVVDDCRPAAEAVSASLAVAGYDVRFVLDGLAALETVSAWVPEIALLDLNMPGMDGYAVARRLRGGSFHPAYNRCSLYCPGRTYRASIRRCIRLRCLLPERRRAQPPVAPARDTGPVARSGS